MPYNIVGDHLRRSESVRTTHDFSNSCKSFQRGRPSKKLFLIYSVPKRIFIRAKKKRYKNQWNREYPIQ